MEVSPKQYNIEIEANAATSYSIFEIDFSLISATHILIEVDTIAYDDLNSTSCIRHSVYSIYNDTGATISPPVIYQDENYSFTEGDSVINEVEYVQSTCIFSQAIEVTNAGERVINVISYVKIIAF